MEEASLPLPVFKTTGIFTVIFQRPEKGSEKGSEKSSEKIIDMIKENPTVTISEMAETLGKSTRAIEKQLAKLKSKGIVIRLGSYKVGYWEVINEESN